MSAGPRLKQAVRRAIHACGGIEGAAATVEKSTSQVGRWNALGEPDLPTLGDALSLDEIAVAGGLRPEIATALARLLGGVFLKLPADFGDAGALPVHVMELAHEVGDVSARVCEAMKDGAVTGAEAAGVEIELDQLIDKAVQARALVRAMQGKPASEVRPVPINAGPARSREA